jgi:hypothetical protein
MNAYATEAADAGALAAATARDNAMVWQREAGHYEVWYLTFQHTPTRTGFWIRYVIESPRVGAGAPYAILWFACFDGNDPTRNVAVHHEVPIAELSANAAPFTLRLGDAELGHDHARGRIQGGGHDVTWDLSWLPARDTHHHLPGIIYKTSFADTRVLSPNLDVPVRGTVTVDGRSFVVEGMPGGQTHLWGRKHAHAWAWGHCNAFDGRRGATLETLTVRLKKRGVVTPPLTVLALYLDGEAHRLTEFQHTLLNRGSFGTARYQLSGRTRDLRLAAEFHCRPADMVNAPYVDPDGEPVWCANTCVANLELTIERRAGLRWSAPERLVASQSACFEVAGRAPDPAITRPHAKV